MFRSSCGKLDLNSVGQDDECSEAQQDRKAWSALIATSGGAFAEICPEHSLRVGDFKLSSGRHSPYLFQLANHDASGSQLLGEVILEYMYQHSIECIGGLNLALSRSYHRLRL
jgi:hypothetical protein